jgi:hypothetical protein
MALESHPKGVRMPRFKSEVWTIVCDILLKESVYTDLVGADLYREPGLSPDRCGMFEVTWLTTMLKTGCSKIQAFLLEVSSLQGLFPAPKGPSRPCVLGQNSLALGVSTSGTQLSHFVQESGWIEPSCSIMHPPK